VDALAAEPGRELDECDDGRAVLLRELDGVADVVAVTMREGDDIDALRRLFVLRTLWIAVQKGVDIDSLAVSGVEPKSGVSQPRQRRVSHRSPLAWVTRA